MTPRRGAGAPSALYVVIGGAGVAILDAATFVVAGVALAAMHPLTEPFRATPPPSGSAGGSTAVRVLRTRPGLWRSTVLGAATMPRPGRPVL